MNPINYEFEGDMPNGFLPEHLMLIEKHQKENPSYKVRGNLGYDNNQFMRLRYTLQITFNPKEDEYSSNS